VAEAVSAIGTASAEGLVPMAAHPFQALFTALNVVGMIAVAMLVLGFVFYVRWRTLRRLQAVMTERSADAAPEDGDSEVGQAATLIRPTLTVFDDLGQLPGAVEAREQFVQRAVALFRQALAIDALAAFGYAALPFLFHALSDGGQTEGANLAIVLAGLYLALAAIRYLLFRTQFRAIDERSRAERVVMFIINLLLAFTPINVHPMTLLKAVLAPRVQVVFLAGWICLAAGVGIGMNEAGLLLAACLHLGLAVWFALRLQRIPGKRLVVLRVFGLDKNTQFLFDGVLAFWKHFGHFFTVVDPAYWRHSHQVLSLGTLVFVGLTTLAVGAGFMMYGALPGPPPEDLAPLAAATFAAPLLGAYAWYSERQVDRTFIRSKDHLNAMLARFEKRPRNLDMTYKSLETRCYDNTWKVTVAEFARQSDAIVMDLRGYSPQRAGCAFEVNYLLDAVPVDRIVFLLDEQSDREAAGALILEAWKELSAGSPNLMNDAPELRFYVATTKDERDIQGVIDLLIRAAAMGQPATA